MTMIRRVLPVEVNQLGEDEVEVVMSTGARARDGHVLEPEGCQVENYMRNPIVLWNHEPEYPVGRAMEVKLDGNKIRSRIKFAPVGVSSKADEIRGLVKSGIVSGVSVGFEPLDSSPLDPAYPKRGMRFTEWELLEQSFCSVPVDADALVTARAKGKEEWHVGASRDLPIEDSDEWDGSAAAKSIFAHAGGDDFDPEVARKGFLAYNSAAPNKRGSYKLPIAHVVDGELKVPKGGIRAAASRLPQANIPEEVKNEARAVLDHYEEKAGMSDKDKAKEKEERSARKAKFVRSLGDVASLAWMLEQLGWLCTSAEIETELEGDNSAVPAKLCAAARQLGEVLVDMTEEELGELFGDKEESDEGMDETARAYIRGATKPRARQWRRGMVMFRARAALQAAHAKDLARAMKHLTRADKRHGETEKAHGAVAEHLERAADAHGKAVDKHEEVGEHLEAAQAAHKEGDHEAAQGHIDNAVKAHRAVNKHHEEVADAHEEAGDAHGDAQDSHAAQGRNLEAAQRCMRSMQTRAEGDDGENDEDDEDDTHQAQTSEGVEKDPADEEGKGKRALTYHQRQAMLLELEAEETDETEFEESAL